MIRSRCIYLVNEPWTRFIFTFPHTMSKSKNKKLNVAHVRENTASKSNTDSPIQLDKSGNVIIRILAKPGAKFNGIINISNEGVGVQIAAPPSEGEANAELIKYLSKVFYLRKSDISLDKGSRSRHKIVLIAKGISTPAAIEEYIRKEIET